MNEAATLLLTIGALSLTVTKVVDTARNAFDKDDTFPRATWNLVALAVGLAFCLGWQIEAASAAVRLIPALADQAERLTGVAGQVLTGFVVGMSAGFWHELLDALSSIAKRNNAVAGAGVEYVDET